MIALTGCHQVYDGQDVILDSNSDNSTIEYINGAGIDNHLRVKDSRFGTYYFGEDQVGSTRELTDESGNVSERVEYDSFGNGDGTQQSSGSRAAQEATVSKSLARENLFEDLARISRTARGMRRAMPGLEDKFRLPGKLKDQELLATARAFAADALPLKDEFIRRGLPEDFIDDLNDDIESFEQAIARQTEGGSTKISATASLEDLAAQGVELLRELDPIMRNIFADDPATLAAWVSACHIERDPRPRRTSPATPPPTTYEGEEIES